MSFIHYDSWKVESEVLTLLMVRIRGVWSLKITKERIKNTLHLFCTHYVYNEDDMNKFSVYRLPFYLCTFLPKKKTVSWVRWFI